MNILAWLLFGMIVGIIAGSIDDKSRNLFSYIALGVGGALAGGFFANMFLNTSYSGFNSISFMIASLGAIAFLFASRAIKRI